MNRYPLCFLIVTMLLYGCAIGKSGSALQGWLEGRDSLSGIELGQEAATLKKMVKKDPANATVNFSYGRVLLATKQPRQALPYLEKAVALNPGNAEYLFWQGVAYGENKRPAQERASYERALQLNKNFVQALVYLGNNHLNAKSFYPALKYYQQALAIAPANAQALYNRAIIYKRLKRTAEEKQAWRLYLVSYPEGELARRAADHLNLLKDFSYRNHRLGPRILTLPAITFSPFGAELTAQAKAALDQVGATVGNLPKGTLDVIVYQKKNRHLANNRALAIKRYLDSRYQVLKTGKPIRLSWFDVPEKRKLAGRTARIDESVVFFLSDIQEKKPIKQNMGKRKR